MAVVCQKRMIDSTFDSWLTLANFLGLPDGVGRKQKLLLQQLTVYPAWGLCLAHTLPASAVVTLFLMSAGQSYKTEQRGAV